MEHGAQQQKLLSVGNMKMPVRFLRRGGGEGGGEDGTENTDFVRQI